MIDLGPSSLVGLGGALGAVARYGVDTRLPGDAFPAGTFVVNVVGSFVLALVTFLGASDAVVLFVGTGACGAFTTFSSFSFETVRRWERGRRDVAILHAGGTLAAAGGAIGLAWAVAGAV